jgi:hypothetical protein
VGKLTEYKEKISSLYQKDENYRKMVDETVLKSTSFNDLLRRIRENAASFQVEMPAAPVVQTTQAQPAANGQAVAQTGKPDDKTVKKN